MNATNILESANGLMTNCNKFEIVAQARALGWKGDHARAPMLQLALFVATKLASGDRGADHAGDRGAEQPADMPQGDMPQGDEPQAAEPQAAEPQNSPSMQEAKQNRADREAADREAADREADEPQADEPQADMPQADEPQADMPQADMPQGDMPQGDMPQGDDEPDAPADHSDEYKTLLKASGITTPHKLLEKVWLLATKAKQNVLLLGPSGSGKTMLSEQLAHLVKLPFSSISCTMGMSESQLTGWLLPEDGGRMAYRPAPFVTSVQMPSVFLLDELDAADANVTMILNSITSNGFITVPQKTDNPTIHRHDDAILIAGCNTINGADDVYSARTLIDGATLDRFYIVECDYDESSEHNLFNLSTKASKKRGAAWKRANTTPSQETMDGLRDWFFALRKAATKNNLARIVSRRMAMRLVACAQVGIPVAELKADQLIAWATDERTRCGV